METLSILGVDALTDLSGLGLVDAGVVFIYSNASLLSLSGLESLTSADGLFIWSNGALLSLDGLEGLDTLGDLDIDRNTSLVDVSALYGLTAVTDSVGVTDNSALTNAAAEALVDEIGSIGGAVTIYGND